MENETIPNCWKLQAGSFLQNKPNLKAGSCPPAAFSPNEPNSPFLYPCIRASLYSYFSPNEPNYPVHPVNPVQNIKITGSTFSRQLKTAGIMVRYPVSI